MSLNDGYTTQEDLVQQGRGPSDHTLWKDCPWSQIGNDFGRGYRFADDFTDAHDLTNKYTATTATTGTFLVIDEEGGVADADCASTTHRQGINVQASSTVGASFATQASGKMWFECRLKASDIATGPEFFVGLHNIDTTVIATSAMNGAAGDYIGFQSLTDDNVLLGVTADNVAQATGVSTTTLVDGTYVKLGFKVTDRSKVEFYVDGVKQTSTQTTRIPSALMVPTLVCQSGGTTDPIVSIDWWMCAVEQVAT